jgi:hypothetical protein
VLDLSRLVPQARPLVTGADSEALARLGISDRGLLRSAFESTRGSGDKALVTQAIKDAMPIVDSMTPNGNGEQVLIDRLRERVRRNLDRVEGRLHDGYSDHPDYAEHGRAIEDAALLARMDDMRSAYPGVRLGVDLVRERTATSATATSATLTW